MQRVRLARCFDAWGRHGEAEREGFSVIESVRGIGGDGNVNSGGLKGLKGCLLPDLGKGKAVDREFAYLVVEVVVILVKCASMIRSEEEGGYRRVLTLVEEVKLWFR